MAIITVVITSDMIRVFAFGNIIVVAGTTGTDYLQMVHTCYRTPPRCTVAVFTNISRINMPWVLALGSCTVVATDTV